MTTVTIDTLKLADRLTQAGFERNQAEAIVRVVAEAQDELVTRSTLQIELAPIRAELMLLKWMIGFNLAFTMAVLWKVFS